LLGSIVTAVYRGSVAGALDSDLPPATLEAARDTLGGALAAAAALPSELGAILVAGSRDAFVEAFRTAALTSAVIALIAAAGIARILGRAERHGPQSSIAR
jgi:DHA2 family multidrug resistance protein-like MFS transporter